MNDPQPRVKSVCMVWRGGDVLVIRAEDKAESQTYYTPLGGGVKFGEYGSDAIVREFKEEIGATIEGVRLIGFLENLFTLEGKPKHEIVLVYEGRLREPTFFDKTVIEGRDTGGQFKAVWKPFSSFNDIDSPLYPKGLFDLVEKSHLNQRKGQ